MVGDLVAVGAVVVRLDHAPESPLIAEDCVEELVVRAAGLRSDPVERAHCRERLALVFLDRDLERLQVDLAERLLRRVGQKERAPVRLLVVHRVVLDVRIHSLRGSAVDLSRRDHARKEAVLGIILKVPARERAPVRVHRGTVPAVVVRVLVLLAHRRADLLRKPRVPCHGHQGLCRVRGAVRAGDEVGQACRSVAVGCADLAYGVDRRGLPSADVDHGRHVIEGELVEQLVPLGIVVRKAGHISQLQAVLRACRRHLVRRIVVFGTVIEAERVLLYFGACSVVHDKVVRFELASAGGVVVRELVLSGEHLEVAPRVVVEPVDRCDIVAVALGLAVVDISGHIEFLFREHGVGIGAEGDRVIACLQDIAAALDLDLLGIIGSHIFQREEEAERL